MKLLVLLNKYRYVICESGSGNTEATPCFLLEASDASVQWPSIEGSFEDDKLRSGRSIQLHDLFCVLNYKGNTSCTDWTCAKDALSGSEYNSLPSCRRERFGTVVLQQRATRR